MTIAELTFLKLGGSLITDKDQPRTPRMDVLERLAQEITEARQAEPGRLLVLGHGSGSFGHTAARKHGTRQGVRTPEEWHGFLEVWQEARALNQIVLGAMRAAGIPVIAFPPSACFTTRGGRPVGWDLSPMRAALAAGLVPLVYGDTVFDRVIGGTIVSTEDVFQYLAEKLHPRRILLAGREEGVWSDFPACTHLIETITPRTFASTAAQVGGSASVDVTGGMREKVRQMLRLSERLDGFQAFIFSGLVPGITRSALLGAAAGTRICLQEERFNTRV